jgi:hypothetical protein
MTHEAIVATKEEMDSRVHLVAVTSGSGPTVEDIPYAQAPSLGPTESDRLWKGSWECGDDRYPMSEAT